ncbi:MAG: hypothetical protein Q4B67_08040 [Eubacteriales bacterium]|nr:hypothetical protein [Eubacteriales bacterium]
MDGLMFVMFCMPLIVVLVFIIFAITGPIEKKGQLRAVEKFYANAPKTRRIMDKFVGISKKDGFGKVITFYEDGVSIVKERGIGDHFSTFIPFHEFVTVNVTYDWLGGGKGHVSIMTRGGDGIPSSIMNDGSVQYATMMASSQTTLLFHSRKDFAIIIEGLQQAAREAIHYRCDYLRNSSDADEYNNFFDMDEEYIDEDDID